MSLLFYPASLTPLCERSGGLINVMNCLFKVSTLLWNSCCRLECSINQPQTTPPYTPSYVNHQGCDWLYSSNLLMQPYALIWLITLSPTLIHRHTVLAVPTVLGHDCAMGIEAAVGIWVGLWESECPWVLPDTSCCGLGGVSSWLRVGDTIYLKLCRWLMEWELLGIFNLLFN